MRTCDPSLVSRYSWTTVNTSCLTGMSNASLRQTNRRGNYGKDTKAPRWADGNDIDQAWLKHEHTVSDECASSNLQVRVMRSRLSGYSQKQSLLEMLCSYGAAINVPGQQELALHAAGRKGVCVVLDPEPLRGDGDAVQAACIRLPCVSFAYVVRPKGSDRPSAFFNMVKDHLRARAAVAHASFVNTMTTISSLPSWQSQCPQKPKCQGTKSSVNDKNSRRYIPCRLAEGRG
jgi:hypothetical protein